MGSPTWSRIEVSRDLELENKATNTGLQLGLVAEMNLLELGLVAEMHLVELGLVADICCRWTRIGVMAEDMWWRIWPRIGGEYVVVYGSSDEVGAVVVYGSSDDDDAVVIYMAATT